MAPLYCRVPPRGGNVTSGKRTAPGHPRPSRAAASARGTPRLGRHDLAALSPVPPTRRVSYGPDRAQFADLYVPPGDGAAWPLVILLHGGCWRERVSLGYFGQAARALTESGVAVWNVEYRRLGGGGGWPMTFGDVADAADLVRTLAPEHALDLSRVVAVGHSAGGGLALWLAGRARLAVGSPLYRPSPLPLRGVVSLAGMPDLEEAARQSLCEGAVQELLGGGPDDKPARYAQGSPAALSPLGVPQVFIHGEEDDIVPHDYVRDYVRRARAGSEDARLETLEHSGHFELVVATTPAWEVVRQAIMKLLGLQKGYAEGTETSRRP